MSAPGDTSIDADRTFTLEELQGNEKVHLNGVASAINPTGTVTGEDYSTRLQEFLTLDHEDEHEPIQHTSHDSGHLDFDVDEEDDEDEEFVYTGVDAPPEPVGYDAQLADILEGDDVQVDGSDVFINSGQDEPLEFGKYKDEVATEASPPSLARSHSQPPPSNLLQVPDPSHSYTHNPHVSRPAFLHPSVSRLRSSVLNQRGRVSSSSTLQTSASHAISPEPSHFSAISRASSVSGPPVPNERPSHGHKAPSPTPKPRADSASESGSVNAPPPEPEREVFRWASLRNVTAQVYSPASSSKAAAVLDLGIGRPTVVVTGGLICIGTHTGRTAVFDFRQQYKFTCGSNLPGTIGAVSALSISEDHTFLAVGHVSGHIFLYDFSRPQNPVRSVTPVGYEAVLAGQKEGHLLGSRINQLSFVGTRHTAFVSADENGLAFYHSLGKVLFVEANDVLRILGNYPEENPNPKPTSKPTTHSRSNSRSPIPFVFPKPNRHQKSAPILSMQSLPTATSSISHPVDSFQVIALLTPIKIIIVGLKPAARTWYRRHRGNGFDDDYRDRGGEGSSWRGAMAWFPSIAKSSDKPPIVPNGSTSNQSKGKSKVDLDVTKPVLAYSWGRVLMLLRVKVEKVPNRQSTPSLVKKKEQPDIPTHTLGLVFEESAEVLADSDIMSIHWLNEDQLLIITTTSLEVYDASTLQLIDSAPSHPADFASCLSHHGSIPKPPSDSDPGYSLRVSLDVYRGKIFVLGARSLQVGTLNSWADRILSFVADGDLLGAIDLTRTYYTGEAKGNKAGLPKDPASMRALVGQRLRDLIGSTAKWIFSEDRLTDETHRTPDGRGVDRTFLFEQFVKVAYAACAALNDYDLLFDDLFDLYDDSGISGIFLEQIQNLVLDGDLRHLPPRISQRLVAFYDDKGAYIIAEKLIWHIDPICLDISQAIRLCQNHELYDALIYVYTSALKDYVSPLVELLGLIRRIQKSRLERPPRYHESSPISVLSVERLVPNAYKIYAYIGDVLSGLTHPSQEKMAEDEANKAKADVYSFLFRGSSTVWQGKLILTADDDHGSEPTYPYLRLLVRFDAEAMLHALDLSFEDSFLNDGDNPISRQDIIDALVELLHAKELSSGDLTFVRIFIARNVPKYTQFIRLSSLILRNILVELSSDTDQSTREDRQLAAEILLSSYSVRDDGELMRLFEEAEFFRILRSINAQEKRWGSLISMYLRDDGLTRSEVFTGVEEVLSNARRGGREGLEEASGTIASALPALLEAGLSDTAMLLDKNIPSLHDQALANLREHAPSKELYYLRQLIQPQLGMDPTLEEADVTPSPSITPSSHLSSSARTRYIELQCATDPTIVLQALQSLPPNYFDLDDVATVCEEESVFDAMAWTLDKTGKAGVIVDKWDTIMESQAIGLAQSGDAESKTQSTLARLRAFAKVSIQICSSHSKDRTGQTDLPADEMWFRLLRSQISAVQAVSSVSRPLSAMDGNVSSKSPENSTLTQLRLMIQETFSALVHQSSSKELSFPLLFKRLVEATSSNSRHGGKTTYDEFRLILGGMLESYRGEEDVLLISKRLVDRDLFELVADLTRARKRGRRMRVTSNMVAATTTT